MVFCTLVLQFYWNNGQNKQRRWHIFEEKTEGKQKSVTLRISVDGKKDSCSSEVEIRWGIVWIKILQNRILKNS